MLKVKLFLSSLFILAFVYLGFAGFHKNVGLNYHYIHGSAATLNYNIRANLFGKNNWNVALAINPHLGAGLDSKISEELFPFFMVPLTLEFHNGMGANYDVLRYKGYSFRLGAAAYNYANFDHPEFFQYGVLIGGDYKFQNGRLNTFSLQWNVVYPIETGLDFMMLGVGFNYHFGLY